MAFLSLVLPAQMWAPTDPWPVLEVAALFWVLVLGLGWQWGNRDRAEVVAEAAAP